MTERWQDYLRQKRVAEQSNVFIFESSDRARQTELIEFVESIKYEQTVSDARQPSIRFGDFSGRMFADMKPLEPRKLWADAWKGLSEYDRYNATWQEIRPPSESSQIPTLILTPQSGGIPFTESIQMIDQALRREPTVAALTGITTEYLANSISLALQSWAHDSEIRAQKSMIVVSTPTSLLFDDYTRTNAGMLVEPPISLESERAAIIQRLVKGFSRQLSFNMDSARQNALVQQTAGMTLHDLESVLLESFNRTGGVDPAFITSAKMRLMKQAGYELVYPRYGWEAMGGYGALREYYTHNIVDTFQDETARQWQLESTRGVIEFGRGGTGKSLRAKILAKESRLPFIKVDASTIISSAYVGQSERRLKQLFKIVESNAPCIVFIDEIDSIGMARGSVMATDSGVQRRTQNMLMDYLGDDERKAIVFGATNRIEHMDIDFLRSGRFDDLIPVMEPDRLARRQIIAVHSQVVRKIPLKLSPAEMESLLDRTLLYTGAEIEDLVKKAARIARTERKEFVTFHHFDSALQNMSIEFNTRRDEVNAFRDAATKLQRVNRAILDQQHKALNSELAEIKKRTEPARHIEVQTQ